MTGTVVFMRSSRRLLAVAAALTAAASLAACGGGELGGAGGALPDGAELLTAGTPVFVSVDGDFDSAQWQAVEALVQRFPSGQEAIDSLLGELTEDLGPEGIDLQSDLRPAIGPEVDIALFDVMNEEPTVVMLTQPTDPSKLEQLLAEDEGDAPVWREVDGWYVLADTQEAIDGALAADGESLADNAAFGDAMEALPGEALARLYLDGAALIAAVAAGAQQQGGLDGAGPNPIDLLGSAGTLQSMALAVVAEDQGVRLEGAVRAEDAPEVETVAAELPEVVPADVLLYGSFYGLDDGLSQLLDTVGAQTPDFDQGLAQIELGLGVSVEEDLLPIFAGEGAVYVRAAAPIPEVTLLLSPEDPARAGATLDKLVSAVALFGSLQGEGADPPFTVTDTTIAGIPAKQLQVNEQLSVYYATVDEQLVITTAVKGIADLVTDGARLADDPLFQEAADTSGMPDETLGFLYVNLEGSVSLLDTLGVLDDKGPEVAANLEPLNYLLVHASGDGDETTFSGFLAIQ
jgi:hypothetical protein